MGAAFKVVTLLAVFLNWSPLSRAQTVSTVAYEGFNYGNAALASQNGGYGWSGAWNSASDYSTSATGLSYSGLTATGGSITWSSDGTNVYDQGNRSLATGVSSANTSVAYIQFLANLGTQTGGGTPNLRLSFQGSATGAVGNNGAANWALLDNGLNVLTGGTSTVALAGLTLVVMRIDYSNSSSSLWLNPNLGTFDFGSPTGANLTVSGFAPAFDNLNFISRSSSSFDEITVMTAASAIPEPATAAAIIGSVALGAAMFFRRKFPTRGSSAARENRAADPAA